MFKSKIYKELTKEQINEIVVDLYGTSTAISQYNLLKGGYFNTTYYIKTNQDKNGIVLRVAPINKHLLFEYEKDMMSTEPYLHQLLHKHNIPTTKILKYVPENTVINREYIITEYIDCIPMNNPSLKGISLQNVYEETGHYTKLIHNLTSNKFGWKRKSGWGEFDKWSDFILAFSNEAANKTMANNLFSSCEIDKFKKIFHRNTDVLDEITHPHMAHGDLWQGNILLKKDKGKYEVAAIIDLDRTIFGDKYWDLSFPWVVKDSFLKGYNEDLPQSNNHKIRSNLYKLLWGFFSSYVFSIEYADKEQFVKEKADSLLLLNSF